MLANKLYVFASRTICLTEATPPIATKIEETVAMDVLIQKIRLCLDGLKVTLQNSIGKMKSKGMIPNAPNSAKMSPKKGNIAARKVAIITDNERKINLGTTLRMEN